MDRVRSEDMDRDSRGQAAPVPLGTATPALGVRLPACPTCPPPTVN